MTNFIKKTSTALFVLFMSQNLFAQEPVDTLNAAFEDVQVQEALLDSLAEGYQLSENPKYLVDSENNSVILTVPDSVYIERLKNIYSPVQLTYNDKVKKFIEAYLKKKQTPYMIGLTDYYFPFFEEQLDKKDLPFELKYLPIIESALNPFATSRSRAVGLWQFILWTGKHYGLQVDSYIDERRDPEKSTLAAVEFLSDLYKEFNDWTLALAAYNCGPGNVKKAIKRAKGKTDYWEIYPYLPRETRGYVPAFIAAVYVMNYYDKHNIVPVKPEIETNTDTIMVSKRLHFMQISEKLNIPIDEIEKMNPQFKKFVIPGSTEKPYVLRLPSRTALEFVAIENEIYGYKDSLFFDSKFVVSTPATHDGKKRRNYETAAYTAPSYTNKKKVSYTVKEGDNYGFIAGWYNVSVADIKYWNDSYSNRLSIGQKLVIWVPIKKYSYYAQVDNMTFEQKQSSKNVAVVSSLATASLTENKPNDSKYVWYKIQQGENLWTIAQKFPGTTFLDLKQINGFSTTQTKKLQAGQYIKIKRK